MKNYINTFLLYFNLDFSWGKKKMKPVKLVKQHELTFEDGLILAKHIYECVVHKTLRDVPEQWQIFYKTYEILYQLLGETDPRRIHDILYKLNLSDIYTTL